MTSSTQFPSTTSSAPSLTWRPLNFSSGLSTRGRLRRGRPMLDSGRCCCSGGGGGGGGGGASTAIWVGWKLLITHDTWREEQRAEFCLDGKMRCSGASWDFAVCSSWEVKRRNIVNGIHDHMSPSLPERQRWRLQWWSPPARRSSGFCVRSPWSPPPAQPGREAPGTGWAWSAGCLWPGTSGSRTSGAQVCVSG